MCRLGATGVGAPRITPPPAESHSDHDPELVPQLHKRVHVTQAPCPQPCFARFALDLGFDMRQASDWLGLSGVANRLGPAPSPVVLVRGRADPHAAFCGNGEVTHQPIRMLLHDSLQYSHAIG